MFTFHGIKENEHPLHFVLTREWKYFLWTLNKIFKVCFDFNQTISKDFFVSYDKIEYGYKERNTSSFDDVKHSVSYTNPDLVVSYS